jgi:hypothetical protein
MNLVISGATRSLLFDRNLVVSPFYYLDAEYLAKLLALGLAFDSAFSVLIAWVFMNYFICQFISRIAVEYGTASAVKVALDLIFPCR